MQEEIIIDEVCLAALRDTRAMLGQPVNVGESEQSVTAVVRLALGADMLVTLCHHQQVQGEEIANTSKSLVSLGKRLNDLRSVDEAVIIKMASLAKHWNLITCSSLPTNAQTCISQQVPLHPFEMTLRGLRATKEEVLKTRRRIEGDFDYLSPSPSSSLSSPSSSLSSPILSHSFVETARKTTTSTNPQRLSLAMRAIRSTSAVPDVAVLLDVDAITAAIDDLHASFAGPSLCSPKTSFLHCFAIKSCPLAFVLSLFVHGLKGHSKISDRLEDAETVRKHGEGGGCGLEAASIVEVVLALRM